MQRPRTKHCAFTPYLFLRVCIPVLTLGLANPPASAQTTYYRSIGTAADHSVNTITATNGSQMITGAGTAWLAANRGRGDRITIPFPAGTVYTIQSVDSETQLTVTTPFTGSTGSGKTYNIARQFATLTSWERCIDNTDSCPGVSSSSLVADNRNEVGVAYKDSAFNERLQFNGTTTDTTRRILLTATANNRHYGIAGNGVVLDGAGFTTVALWFRDEFVTVEWLEITGGDASGAFGADISGNGSPNKLTIRNCIFQSLPGDAITVSNVNADVDFYNNIMHGVSGNGIVFAGAPNNARVFNNTIYGGGSDGVSGTAGSGLILRNNISHSNSGADFNISGINGASSHNLASDATGTSHSPSGGGQNSVPLANLNFVDDMLPGLDLHTTSGSAAEDCGGVPAQPCQASSFFDFDIDGGPRQTPWDLGADDINDATAVELASFAASGADGAVELSWATSSELNNLGFHVYRSRSEAGRYERITASAIPGLGSSPVGARYRYRDTGLANGVRYYYKLEDIETTGKTELHGPVSATPVASSATSSSESSFGESETSAARIAYGEPSANGLRILKRTARKVVLELRTGGFYAEPGEDGSVRLVVPGFEALTGASGPAIPVKRSWVEAVAGRKVELESVSAREVEAFTSLRPSMAEVSGLVATREGTVRATRRRARKAFAEAGLHPSDAARVVSVGFQGDAKKALVELAPLRWDATTGQLLLARRLVVTLSFRGREPSERATDGVRGRRYHSARSHGRRTVVARLHTTERGLYGIRYEDVMRGRRGARAQTLRLSRQGEPVAYHLEPDARRFAPGSVLYFVSEGAGANPYGTEAVYELEVGSVGEVMASSPAAPSGERESLYRHRAEWEQDRYYQAALVDAPDLWLWDVLFAPDRKSYPLEVSALAAGASELSVWLQGVSDFGASPDHHVRVYVNGTLVQESSWDGKQARQLDIELAPGLVHAGDNVLELENVGDTEAAYSMVMLDRYAVEYPRVAVTSNGSLEGRWSQSGTAELSGLAAGAHIIDVSGAQPRWLSGAELGAEGVLRFRAEAGRRYLAVSPEAVHRPVVSRPMASGLKKGHHRADYIVVAPRAFLPVAEPLLALRRSQGLRVKAVSIEELYSAFGFGESTPEAVKDFLSFAYHRWKTPPRYVLLMGDGTFDFKDHLKTGVTNQVPPRMVKTSYLWTASDPSYAAVNGDDLLPDFAIGRLPAATVDELRVMVDKILAYERGEVGVHRSAVVLVADNPDRGGDFEADARSLATGVLASKHPSSIFFSELGTTETRHAIIQSFDDGASLVSYMGHGGIHLWADENFFNRNDVATLQPQSQQPLLLTMNCLNGYFHFPYFDSLAEALVQAEHKGAIAAFSPSGLSLNGPANLYHQALLQELFHGKHGRLGDAVVAAQAAYAETGAFPELLTIYHLLGDPALELR